VAPSPGLKPLHPDHEQQDHQTVEDLRKIHKKGRPLRGKTRKRNPISGTSDCGNWAHPEVEEEVSQSAYLPY